MIHRLRPGYACMLRHCYPADHINFKVTSIFLFRFRYSNQMGVLRPLYYTKWDRKSKAYNWINWNKLNSCIEFSVGDFAFSQFYCCKNKLKQFENHTGHCTCKTTLCNFSPRIYSVQITTHKFGILSLTGVPQNFPTPVIRGGSRNFKTRGGGGPGVVEFLDALMSRHTYLKYCMFLLEE